MSMDRSQVGPLRTVVGIQSRKDSPNVMLALDCGHRKIHRGMLKAPKRACCLECIAK